MPPTHASSTTRHNVTARRTKRTKKENIARFVLVMAGALLIVALLINLHIIEGVEDSYHVRLQQQIATQHTLLKRWYEHEREISQYLAESPAFSNLFTGFVTAKSDDLRAQARSELQQLIERHKRRIAAAGFFAADMAGKVVIATVKQAEGAQLPPQVIQFLHTVLAEGTGVSGFADAAELFPSLGINRPLLLVGTSLRAADANFALISVLDPKTEFKMLTEVFSNEESANPYLVNRAGRLISPLPEALAAGMRDKLGPDQHQRFFNIRLTLPDSSQLTYAAQSVTSGTDAIKVDGYTDFRGLEVMGAWIWDEQLKAGLIVEVERDAAFDLLSPLVYGEYALYTILVLSVLGAIFLRYRVRALSEEVDSLANLGQYKLEDKIGEGGMGSVYRARHTLLQRPTAIKLLRLDQTSGEALERFEREVQQTSHLRHPNTINIYDFGVSETGRFFYVMELLEGFPLSELISDFGPQPQSRVAHILLQICRSLEEAHQQGIVHRDIKPPNVMLCRMGTEYDFVKVLDFGLVKEMASEEEFELTQTQSVTGTAAYISPERLRNPREASPLVDIYSIGVVAYNLLTAKDPHQAKSPLQMVSKILSEAPIDIGTQTAQVIEPALANLVMSCIDRDPGNRPQSVSEMMQTLDAICTRLTWSRREAQTVWNNNAEKLVGMQRRNDPAPSTTQRRTARQ